MGHLPEEFSRRRRWLVPTHDVRRRLATANPEARQPPTSGWGGRRRCSWVPAKAARRTAGHMEAGETDRSEAHFEGLPATKPAIVTVTFILNSSGWSAVIPESTEYFGAVSMRFSSNGTGDDTQKTFPQKKRRTRGKCKRLMMVKRGWAWFQRPRSDPAIVPQLSTEQQLPYVL